MAFAAHSEPAMFRLAAKCPALPEDEIRALIERAQRGEIAARQRVIQANIRLVVLRTMRMTGDARLAAELIGEGAIALNRAVDLFDLSRKDPATGRPIKFCTYATQWIDQRIGRSRAQVGPAQVYVPVHLQTDASRRRSDSSAGLIEAAATATSFSSYLSLEAPVSTYDDEAMTLGNAIPANDTSPEEVVVERLSREKVQAEIERFLSTLSKRDAGILRARLIEGEELRAIGARIGLSRERVRQLVEHGLSELMLYLKERGIAAPSVVTPRMKARPSGRRAVRLILTHDGVTDDLAGWSKRLGICERALRWRRQAGWSVADVLRPDVAKGVPLARRQPSQTQGVTR